MVKPRFKGRASINPSGASTNPDRPAGAGGHNMRDRATIRRLNMYRQKERRNMAPATTMSVSDLTFWITNLLLPIPTNQNFGDKDFTLKALWKAKFCANFSFIA